jgi:hypothetical protein
MDYASPYMPQASNPGMPQEVPGNITPGQSFGMASMRKGEMNSYVTPMGNNNGADSGLNPTLYEAKQANSPYYQHTTDPSKTNAYLQNRGLNTPAPNSSQIPVGGALLNSIGPVAQLAGTLINGVDPVNFDRVNPNYVNYDPMVDIARRNAGTAYANNRGNVRNNATSSGQALTNLGVGNAAITKGLNNTIGGLKTQEYNTNAQIANQAAAQNAGIQMQEQIARDQNKAAYRQAIYGALTDIGNIGAGYMKDNALLDAQEVNNQRTLSMLSSLPGAYEWVDGKLVRR